MLGGRIGPRRKGHEILALSGKRRALARAYAVVSISSVAIGLGVTGSAEGAVTPSVTAAGSQVAKASPAVAAARLQPVVLGPALLAQPLDPRDLDCMTKAVYYEARGETAAGQAAVAQVVLNRVGQGSFAPSVCGVVYQGAGTGDCQFSFACHGRTAKSRLEPDAWATSRAVAARALSGYVMPEIHGATYFHVASLGAVWGRKMAPVARVGRHVFYSPGGRRDLGRAYQVLEAQAKTAPAARAAAAQPVRETLRGPEKPAAPLTGLQAASSAQSDSAAAGPRTAS